MNEHRKGSPSQRILKVDHDAQAVAGERVFRTFLELHDVPHTYSGWDLRATGDCYDFLIRGDMVDVKTRSSNYRDLDIMNYDVIVDEPRLGHQWDKPMDYYVFALLRPNLMEVSLLGWATKRDFQYAPSYRFIERGWPMFGNVIANEDVHLMKVYDLRPMRELLEPSTVELEAKLGKWR